MRIRYTGHGEVVVPPYGPWQSAEVKEISDENVAAGLVVRPDFVEVREKKTPAAVKEETPATKAPAPPRRKRGGS